MKSTVQACTWHGWMVHYLPYFLLFFWHQIDWFRVLHFCKIWLKKRESSSNNQLVKIDRHFIKLMRKGSQETGMVYFARYDSIFAESDPIYSCRYPIDYGSLHVLLLVVFHEITGPQGQVVPEQLHDGGGVAVLLLLEVFQIRDCVVECGLG